MSESKYTPAEAQFHTSSIYPIPQGYKPWKIRNDYPNPKPQVIKPSSPYQPLVPEVPPIGVPDAPWLDFDFNTPKGAQQYIEVIKEYCFAGMVDNEFVPQLNTVRDWYHAPWMHYGAAGREPLHGLTSERYCPPGELSATQKRITQTWAVGFFNSAGASVFGGMWKDPNNPKWDSDILFPLGTLVFKLLFTDATDDEVPSLFGAPTWDAMIAAAQSTGPDPKVRTDKPKPVRIIQMDVAARDDRASIGWTFGTFMYNGFQEDKKGWDALMPVGLQWGNDPELTQAAYEAGDKPKEAWIDPTATALRASLHGYRPSWGWNGRLNGPADNFISACASCHSTSEWPHRGVNMVPDIVKKKDGTWAPVDDAKAMQYFRNIPAGKPFTEGAVSGDYSLQLLIGYDNFTAWNTPVGRGPANDIPHLPVHPRQGDWKYEEEV